MRSKSAIIFLVIMTPTINFDSKFVLNNLIGHRLVNVDVEKYFYKRKMKPFYGMLLHQKM